MNNIAVDGITLVALNVALWLVSLCIAKTWPVDFIWSNWVLPAPR